MKNPQGQQQFEYEMSVGDKGDITVRIQGNMDATNASQMIKELTALLKTRSPSSLTVDLRNVTYLDDFGTLVLVELKEIMTGRKAGFYLINASDSIRETLSILDLTRSARVSK